MAANIPATMRKDMTMSKVFEFGSTHDIELKGTALVVERTADFFQIARQLSDFLAGLPLDRPANDRLVELMVEQVQQAEKGAFLQGFRMGMEFTGWEQGKSKPQKKPSVLN